MGQNQSQYSFFLKAFSTTIFEAGWSKTTLKDEEKAQPAGDEPEIEIKAEIAEDNSEHEKLNKIGGVQQLLFGEDIKEEKMEYIKKENKEKIGKREEVLLMESLEQEEPPVAHQRNQKACEFEERMKIGPYGLGVLAKSKIPICKLPQERAYGGKWAHSILFVAGDSDKNIRWNTPDEIVIQLMSRFPMVRAVANQMIVFRSTENNTTAHMHTSAKTTTRRMVMNKDMLEVLQHGSRGEFVFREKNGKQIVDAGRIQLVSGDPDQLSHWGVRRFQIV